MIFLAVVATPIMTLPQVYQIWFEHARGASVITWSAYVIIAFMWLIYGIKHNDKPLILMEIPCIFIYSLVVIGLLR